MRSLLPLLPKPSRYLGIEEGAVHKEQETLELHCALAFPDMYEVGMSYLGQKILYAIMNAHPGWWAERVMAPCREAGALLRRYEKPLCTLESGTPLARMHYIGFSITHELCYTNILYMLDLAGIPLRSRDRGDDLHTWPIIMAGGGATLSAEPMAPFLDLMVLGDGEETLPEVSALLVRARRNNWTRRQFLLEVRHIPGVYVPSFFAEQADGSVKPLLPDYPGAVRRIVADINTVPYPVQQVVPIGAVHNRLSLEIARGCSRGCRFCHAGMVYRPVRERSLENLQETLEACLRETGFDEVSFLSLSTGDFSALRHLFTATMDRCVQEQIAVSLPSLRVGSVDDSIMARLADIRRTGATLAPEAGSQRLRNVINKGVTEEQLILHVQKLLEHGWQQVKLYFMLGLPTETRADLDAIVDLCLKVRDAAGRGGRRLAVTAALSPFVPKPFTPFQWERQISCEEIKQRVFYLRDQFKRQKYLKMRWHEPEMSHLEGILSRADRRMADVVELAYRKGALFSSWVEHFSLAPWLEALEACGLKAEDYTCARVPGAPLPWDHLDAGVDPKFLLRERRRALAEKVTQDCRYHTCRQCGICDTKGRASRLPHLEEGQHVQHLLNRRERDQQTLVPRRDEQGRVICPTAKAAPPQIAPELTVKAVRFRIWHTKEKRSAFLSQLELQALLERALRRAELPASFSRGFHPLPLLSFGRALPVGVSSRAEWFAITLRRAVAPEDVGSRLNVCLPEGMRVFRVEPVAVNGHMEQAVSETFQAAHGGDADARTAFLECWQRFAAQNSVLWTRETKKGERTTDLRALIKCLAVQADGSVIFTTDWSGGYLSPLSLVLEIIGREQHPWLHVVKLDQCFAGSCLYGQNHG